LIEYDHGDQIPALLLQSRHSRPNSTKTPGGVTRLLEEAQHVRMHAEWAMGLNILDVQGYVEDTRQYPHIVCDKLAILYKQLKRE
jgi:hypothetical protein